VIFNLRELELEDVDGRFGMRSLTRDVGGTLTGMSVYEVAPGKKHWPYHFEVNEEEWLFVIVGELVLRTPEGERVLRAGDVVCFPAGVAHAVRNDSAAPARFAMPSTRAKYGGAVVYPHSGKFRIAAPGFLHRGYLGEQVEYWQGEE
jgi:uncharacterized cupin superfamily protein